MKVINSNELTQALEEVLNIENILIVGPSQINEKQSINDDSIVDELRANFIKIFDQVRQEIGNFIKKKEGTIAFLLNPLVFEGGDNIYSPIYNMAIESFMKSLFKELNPFHIKLMCIILPLSFNDKVVKDYNLIALKYRGIKLEKQVEEIAILLDNSRIFNGQTISLESKLDI